MKTLFSSVIDDGRDVKVNHRENGDISSTYDAFRK